MSGAISPLPRYALMAWCLVKHRDNFTFTFTKFMQEHHFTSVHDSLIPAAVITISFSCYKQASTLTTQYLPSCPPVTSGSCGQSLVPSDNVLKVRSHSSSFMVILHETEHWLHLEQQTVQTTWQPEAVIKMEGNCTILTI